MSKITVFGGSGFIGSTFLRLFPDDTVKCPHRYKVIPPESATNNIVNFVSTTHNYHALDHKVYEDINVNLYYLMDFLKSAHNKFGSDFVFDQISSWFVYGPQHTLPVKEDAVCDPRGFYSITKRAAEQLLISYCETHKIKWRILRLANVFGFGDKYSARKNAFQYLLKQIVDKKPINLYYNGDVIRDFIWVEDCAKAIKLVIDKGELNSIYNIGSGWPWKFSDLVMAAQESMDEPIQINNIDPPDFHKTVQTKDFYLDVVKLRWLGFQTTKNPIQFVGEFIEHEKNQIKKAALPCGSS